MNSAKKRLSAIFATILDEAMHNRDFADRLELALGDESPSKSRLAERLPTAAPNQSQSRRPNRRAKGLVDPFALLTGGENHLRTELARLNLEQLKDIVAEHGMDTSRLALKWKSNDRLVNFIITTVVARQRKGDVFRDNATLGTSIPTATGTPAVSSGANAPEIADTLPGNPPKPMP